MNAQASPNAALSVNEALTQLAGLEGLPICVAGILHFEFEHVALWHHPKAERGECLESSIWLGTGHGSLQFNESAMKSLHGHRVQVLGTLHGPHPGFDGCGHFSGWPAEMLVSSIDRV